MGALVNGAKVAQLLGVTRQRVTQLHQGADVRFPEPQRVVSWGKVTVRLWDIHAIEAYRRDRHLFCGTCGQLRGLEHNTWACRKIGEARRGSK